MTEPNKKKPGLLGRPGNFEPQKSYNEDASSNNIKSNISSNQKVKKKNETKDFKNQQASLKISSRSKEELEALMKITNTKFTYEIIDLLIDRYVENELTPQEKRRFKALTDF